MRGPQGVWIQNGKLFVADTQNNRVLIFNQIPTKNGVAADVVVGELAAELPQAASPRPEAATATRVQVRRRVMWRFLSRRREDGSGGPVSRARR